jgi:hypothetical protein
VWDERIGGRGVGLSGTGRFVEEPSASFRSLGKQAPAARAEHSKDFVRDTRF